MYDVAMQAISDQRGTSGQSECWNCCQPGDPGHRGFCRLGGDAVARRCRRFRLSVFVGTAGVQ
eukprot:2906917-Rhodomonas_salina.1